MKITSTFVRTARASDDSPALFEATDSLGTAPQNFTAQQLVSWLVWHLRENRAVRVTVESERAEAPRPALVPKRTQDIG